MNLIRQHSRRMSGQVMAQADVSHLTTVVRLWFFSSKDEKPRPDQIQIRLADQQKSVNWRLTMELGEARKLIERLTEVVNREESTDNG